VRLHSPDFEKRLQGLIRAECKKSKQLRAERKRARRGGAAGSKVEAYRLVVGVALCGLLLAMVHRHAHSPALISVALALWAALYAFKIAQSLLGHLFHSSDLAVLTHYPLEVDQIFLIQARRFFGGLGRLALEISAPFLVLAADAYWRGDPYAWLLAAGALQLPLVAACGFHLAVRASWIPFGPVAGAIFWGLLLAVYWWKALAEYGSHIHFATDLLLPTGWLNLAMQGLLAKGEWQMAALLIPIAALIAAAPRSLARLREYYSHIQFVEAEPSEPSEDEGGERESAPGPADGEVMQRGVTATSDRLLDREFLAPVDWSAQGFLEGKIASTLGERQRVLLEFLTAGSAEWSRGIKRALITAVVGCLAVAFSGKLAAVISWVTAYLVLIMAFPNLSVEWRGLRTHSAPGGFIPHHAFVPVRFGEVMRLLCKVNLLRCLAAAPVGLAVGVTVGLALEADWATSLASTAKVLLAWAAAQPVMILFQLSNGTNDTLRIRGRVLLIALCMIAIGVCVVAMFITERAAPAAAFIGLILALSWACVAIYAGAHRKCKFDLVAGKAVEGD